jgi:hypothetical protein
MISLLHGACMHAVMRMLSAWVRMVSPSAAGNNAAHRAACRIITHGELVSCFWGLRLVAAAWVLLVADLVEGRTCCCCLTRYCVR